MTCLTPDFIVATAKTALNAEEEVMTRRPAGYPRAAWSHENPTGLPTSWLVRDTAFKTKPVRKFSIGGNGNPYDLWVWGTGNSSRVIEHIDLRGEDAVDRLARYEVV